MTIDNEKIADKLKILGNIKLFESLMPDGKEIEKITFTHLQGGVEGETVELIGNEKRL